MWILKATFDCLQYGKQCTATEQESCQDFAATRQRNHKMSLSNPLLPSFLALEILGDEGWGGYRVVQWLGSLEHWCENLGTLRLGLPGSTFGALSQGSQKTSVASTVPKFKAKA